MQLKVLLDVEFHTYTNTFQFLNQPAFCQLTSSLSKELGGQPAFDPLGTVWHGLLFDIAVGEL